MEYGIHVLDASPLPQDPREVCKAAWRSILPAGTLRALYFGSDFCADLLPGRVEVGRFCARAQSAGLEAVLLTPVVAPAGLSRIEKLLAGLTQDQQLPAVVFNDWGVANLLRDSFPHFPRRAGRLMNRGLRDPRLMSQVEAKPAAGSDVTERGHHLRALLVNLGAVALETDPDMEGGFLGDGSEGMQRVLYLPYAFAASSRNCLVKAESAQSIDECFTRGLALPCNAPCRGQWHRIERSDTSLPLWRAGNTVFFEVPRHRVEMQLRHTDRIVLQERPAP